MNPRILILIGLGIFAFFVLCCGGVFTTYFLLRPVQVASINTAPVGVSTTAPVTRPPPTVKPPPPPPPPVYKPVANQVPPEPELRRLTSASLLDLDMAIKSKNFKSFHGNLAKIARQRSPEELLKQFQIFQNADMTGVKNVAPVWAEPARLEGDGVLIARGEYPATPSRVTFRLTYHFENGNWRLASWDLGVKTGPPPPAPAPPPPRK